VGANVFKLVDLMGQKLERGKKEREHLREKRKKGKIALSVQGHTRSGPAMVADWKSPMVIDSRRGGGRLYG
jgi:hypothetical protein